MIANLMGGDGLIILVIAIVVLLGGSQLPKIARNVGTAGKEFRKAQEEAEEDAERQKQAKAAGQSAAPQPPPPQPLPAPPVAAAPVAAQAETAAGSPGASGDASITLTPAQLDALLKAREQQVKGESPGSSN